MKELQLKAIELKALGERAGVPNEITLNTPHISRVEFYEIKKNGDKYLRAFADVTFTDTGRVSAAAYWVESVRKRERVAVKHLADTLAYLAEINARRA
jgi:hypothetical protein